VSREQVSLYDPLTDQVCGVAPRDEVRARNLPHAGTAVLLTDSAGRVYVHRRTDTKDVYPGRWDCWAGGVVAAGETPANAAVRELAEELGVRDVSLEPLSQQWYRDEHVHYLAVTFRAVYDGPVTLQADEVAEGCWMTWDELRDLLDDPHRPFVPDGRLAIEQLLSVGVLSAGLST